MSIPGYKDVLGFKPCRAVDVEGYENPGGIRDEVKFQGAFQVITA